MAAEDMFTSTTGQSYESEDCTFESLSAALAVRKCRLFKKKEMCQMMLQEMKSNCERVEKAKKDNRALKKEVKEANHQQASNLSNLKRSIENRESLETMLNDLKAKIAETKSENKRMKEEYDEVMRDARETWASYEKVYEEFPLAKQNRELKVKTERITNDISAIKDEIAHVKQCAREKAEAEEKNFFDWGINLAKIYFEYQKASEEGHSILKKKRELEKVIEDIKAGKSTNTNSSDISKSILRIAQVKDKQETSSFPNSIEFKMPGINTRSFPNSIEFKMPDININSPPPADSISLSSGSSLFNWNSLLNFSRKPQNKETQATNKTSDLLTRTTTNQSSNNHQVENKNLYWQKKVKEINISDELNLNKSLKSSSQSNYNGLSVSKPSYLEEKEKRKTSEAENTMDENIEHVEQPLQPLKKVKHFENSQNKARIQTFDDTQSIQQNPMKKSTDVVVPSNTNTGDKENLNPISNRIPVVKDYLSDLQSIKNSLPLKSQKEFLPQNLDNFQQFKHSGNQKKNLELENILQKNCVSSSEIQKPENLTEKYQQISKEHSNNENTDNDMFLNDNDKEENENIVMSMDLNSPPDVIPTETHSQSSQSGKVISQSLSDFQSPIELTEEEKKHFQRISAESPDFVYQRGCLPELKSSLKPAPEVAGAVRSEYFAELSPTLPSKTNQTKLKTPPMLQDDYHHPTYSSPMGNVFSPPSATIGGFSSENTSSGLPFTNFPKKDDNKESYKAFNFNFSSGPSNSNSSNFFSLF